MMNLARLRIRNPRQKYWVLRNISFDVEQGQMVGIIGVNGSGKSTTLKLISRIIEPTEGRVEANGRVSALLELGAGFHPDLTGRENVYLNGSILGLNRHEIGRRFDRIVQFAGLESSIDIPVRFYSSGMYMRLGFSVAAHADPEILLVDEVLAVGDYAYQAKCLQRIEELREQGVTIVFVSHDMETVKEMCDRAIWLDGGGVRADGDPDSVVAQYLSGFEGAGLAHGGGKSKLVRGQRWGNGEIEIVDVSFAGEDGCEKGVFYTGEPLCVRVRYRAGRCIRDPVFGVSLYASSGVQINSTDMRTSGYRLDAVEGEGVVEYRARSLPLLEGSYLVSVFVYDHSGDVPVAYDHLEKAFILHMLNGEGIDEWTGTVHIPSTWECDGSELLPGAKGGRDG
jgi:ABC-type polysaccharide/polyol phosphate transport system ATPase subunit